MTVSELISMLATYPDDARVTLLDADKRWLLPIKVTPLPAGGSAREVDFIAITADGASDEIEGVVNGPRWGHAASARQLHLTE
jgi:hypothetical protein